MPSRGGMNEFALIRHYFTGLTCADTGVLLGIGDDAAIVAAPLGELLVISTDTLVAGRHFPLDALPTDIAYKALAVNLSDLAAMGAQPLWFTLALTLPEVNESWLAAFAGGLKALADAHGIALIGGDTTRGPLSITLTVLGCTPQPLRRSGAQPADLLCVTGSLGDAGAGLALHQQRLAPTQGAEQLLARLHRPTPRIEAGLALRGLATAALDISDGLAGDLPHLLAASGVGATVQLAQLPTSPAFLAHCPPSQRATLQTQAGDDYELCLSLPPIHWPAAQQRMAALGLPITVIGHITAEPALFWLAAEGSPLPLSGGYQHF